MRLEDLMERAAQYDENLARDIKDYVHGRKYGLVYEASKPEFVRMWKKPVVRGDIVNILPPRGVMEDTKNEDDPSETVYKVIAISKGVATLRDEKTGETVTASVDDIVALARFDKPIYAGLKETGRVERGGDKPYHVVINGENYHALQTLVYAYQGQVDCIYIDPPYNTGATDWKYNNNYVGKDDKYRHSKWLTFMEDRLRLAKKLLNPKDSVLIVTIDEKEYLRLGLLLEQLFPEANIQMVSTVIKRGGSQRTGEFARSNEYIYFLQNGECEITPEKTEDKNVPVQWRQLHRNGKTGHRKARPNLFYPIYVNRITKKIECWGESLPIDMDRNDAPQIDNCIPVFPIVDNGNEMTWGLSQKTAKAAYEKGCLRIGDYKPNKPQQFVVSYLADGVIRDIESGKATVDGYNADGSIIAHYEGGTVKMPTTVWDNPLHDARDYGTYVFKNIFQDQRFPYPKSIYAVRDAISLFIANKPNALVVDFFAGSGTTLHAINILNSEKMHGHRRCILVTNNEVSEDEEISMTKSGLRPTDKEWQNLGIANYVTWPRTVCSIEGHDVNDNPLKGNYIGSDRPMSDGFEENAIFFDLEYLEPSVVNADLAFDRIAPILWLAGGCKGEILQRQKGYVIGETYAVLFDPRYKTRFVDAVLENKEIKTVFIVTDAAERYRSLCAELPGCRVMQLYESYLRSFEINAIG